MRRSLCLLLFAGIAVCPLLQARAGDGALAAKKADTTTPVLSAAPVSPLKPPFPVDAHLDAYAKFGSDRRLGGTDAFLPLSWNGQVLSFADVRFVADDADGREVNAGLGLRRVSEDASHILGGYGFLDRRRSPTGNLYTQATVGAEFLAESWDFRVNAYAPLTGEKTLSETALPASLSLSGTGIVASGGTATAKEKPLFGADFEIGYKLGFLKDTWFDDTRAYAGAYHFDAKNAESMDGARFRVETAPFEWLRFGAEVQRDNIRGETGFVEARIRVPLDFWRGTKHGPARPKGILKRIDTRIARDVDVVTRTGTVRQEKTETVLNATTGTAQKVYVVDNTAAAGGDGSAENPFNTLAGAQGAAGAHGIIYVKAGDGTSAGMNAGVTLSATGQKLIGSGVALAFDADTMRVARIPGLTDGAVIESATSAPVVTNAAGNGVSITADSVEVAGLSVSAASDNGIYAYNVDDVVLRDITATGNTNDGIKIEASGAGVSVTGVSVEDVTAIGNRNGIRLYARDDASLAAKVEGSTATGNTQHGIVVYDDSTAGSVDADLGGGSQGGAGLNAITGNTLEDLALDTDGAALSAQNNWWGQTGGPATTEIYEGAPLQNGLVMNWTFDDGTARDRSGYGYDGTLINGPTPSSGTLDFNNPADNESVQGVDVNESDTGNKLSVFLRMRPDSLIATQTLVMKWDYAGNTQNSWGVRATNADASNLFFFIAENVDAGNNYFTTTNANLTAGTWNQIGFVYDGAGATNADRLKTYKDATQLNGAFTGTIPVGLNASPHPVRVAFPLINNPAFAQPFDGLIDDVRIYNRALSAPEIAELYRMDATGTVTTTGALAGAP
jgi:hypothetical protein